MRWFWASLIAQLVKNLPAMRETGFDPCVGKIPWRRERLPTPVFWPGEFHGLYSPLGSKESDTTFTFTSSPRMAHGFYYREEVVLIGRGVQGWSPMDILRAQKWKSSPGLTNEVCCNCCSSNGDFLE